MRPTCYDRLVNKHINNNNWKKWGKREKEEGTRKEAMGMGCVCVEHLASPLLSPEQLGIIAELEGTELPLAFGLEPGNKNLETI